MYRKLPNIVKELENFQFFQNLGHSEKTLDHKLCIFSQKRASDLVLSSGAFRSFHFTEIFQFPIQIHWKFDFLRSILSHFPTEVCKYSFKSLLDYEFFSLRWTFSNILTPKRFKKYTSCTKTSLLKFFDSFGVILKCFWWKPLQRFTQKT